MTTLLDTTTATELPGVVAQTPATRPDLSRYRILTSSALLSLAEAEARLGGFTRPVDRAAVKKLAALLTAKRRAAEEARAWARKRERQRWAGIEEGKIAPLDSIAAFWAHPPVNSRAKRSPREKAAA